MAIAFFSPSLVSLSRTACVQATYHLWIRSVHSSAGSCCWLLLRALWPDFSDGTERQQLRQLLVMKLFCHSARKRRTDREREIPSFPSPTPCSCSACRNPWPAAYVAPSRHRHHGVHQAELPILIAMAFAVGQVRFRLCCCFIEFHFNVVFIVWTCTPTRFSLAEICM